MIAKQCLILCLLLFTAFDLSLAQDTGANALNEFQEFTADSVITTLSSPSAAQNTIHVGSETHNIVWVLAVLLFTALAGIFVRFKQIRQLRSLFLVLSIVV